MSATALARTTDATALADQGARSPRVWKTAAPPRMTQPSSHPDTRSAGPDSAALEVGGDAPVETPDGVIALRHVLPRINAPATDTFRLLQQFEGTVLEIGQEEFTARLVDRTDPRNPIEIADFSLDDVAVGDRELLAPGAVFYFSVGYRVATWGQRYREATVKFRRLPAWSRRDVEKARAQAESWSWLIEDDGSR